jgi:hypothetical protein
MPDEKIDQKRPVQAETEPKPIQQRHVDDTVDDSFPASDPPAWTTSASKSVAAECEPDFDDSPPIPPGQGLDSASDEDGLLQRGWSYVRESAPRLREAGPMLQRGSQAVSRPVEEHPVTALIVGVALGCALGWLVGSRSRSAASEGRRPVYNRRPREAATARPAPLASAARTPFPAGGEPDIASHTGNSF